jgi:hypothetical protein
MGKLVGTYVLQSVACSSFEKIGAWLMFVIQWKLVTTVIFIVTSRLLVPSCYSYTTFMMVAEYWCIIFALTELAFPSVLWKWVLTNFYSCLRAEMSPNLFLVLLLSITLYCFHSQREFIPLTSEENREAGPKTASSHGYRHCECLLSFQKFWKIAGQLNTLHLALSHWISGKLDKHASIVHIHKHNE